MQGLDPPWLPSSWALDALWSHLGWSLGTSTHPVALLLTTAAASFFVTGWVFRSLHPRAFSRAQEGLQRERGARSGGRASLSELVSAGLEDGRRMSFAHGLRWKDRLVFVRDSAQWSQMLILAAIVAIYVLNFKYIRVVAGTGLVSDLGLHFLNLGLCGFVTIALAARFVFPAVSLEGRAFWLVLSSPNSMSAFLRAKVWAWFIPMAVFANLLMVLTHVFVGADNGPSAVCRFDDHAPGLRSGRSGDRARRTLSSLRRRQPGRGDDGSWRSPLHADKRCVGGRSHSGRNLPDRSDCEGPSPRVGARPGRPGERLRVRGCRRPTAAAGFKVRSSASASGISRRVGPDLLPVGVFVEQIPQRIHELADILETAVDAGEAHVRDLVETAQLVDDDAADVFG